jgi:hypothetical protein
MSPGHTDDRDHPLRWIATTHSDCSRPGMKAPMGTVGDSQYSRLASSGVEAVPVVNRRDPRALRSAPTADAAARAGGCLLTHGGGRDDGSACHFLAPFDDLPSAAVGVADCAGGSIASAALILRIDGPSSSSR